ncbi:MAG TPA: HAD family hydrolase [Acidimicrobiales bacterium]|nr:HAD family hydrolase [Acidimicrobiales bacterium]
MRPFVFDLDGTLITCREKQVAVAGRALSDVGWPGEVDERRFWALKRAGATTSEALTTVGVPSAAAGAAARRWQELIERREWLLFDRTYPTSFGAIELVRSQGLAPTLLTARKDAASVGWEIRRLGLDAVVAEVIVVRPSLAHAGKRDALGRLSPVAFVGDTETDHSASQAAGVRFAAVTCGQRNAEYLRRAGAEYRFPDVLSATVAVLRSPAMADQS